MKRVIAAIAGVAVFAVLVFCTWFYLDFRSGTKMVGRFCQDSTAKRIENLGATKTLEVLPLVDWYGDGLGLKGEAGVSYLVKTDDSVILFDVGSNFRKEDPSPLLNNMKKLGVDLDKINVIVISHDHMDHVGGIKWSKEKTFSLTTSQIDLGAKRVYTPVPMTYPGLKPICATSPAIISKGVATTGAIPRYLFLTGWTPEQALVINVEGKGLVLVVGCGHQTVSRLIKRARELSDAPIYGIVGGLHYAVTDSRMKILGIPVQKLYGTGKPPWSPITMEDVNKDIKILSRIKPEIVALSPHDSCDASLNAFRKAFPAAYRDIRVGKSLVIGQGYR